MRDILLFMAEYPVWKKSQGEPTERTAFADEVDWL